MSVPGNSRSFAQNVTGIHMTYSDFLNYMDMFFGEHVKSLYILVFAVGLTGLIEGLIMHFAEKKRNGCLVLFISAFIFAIGLVGWLVTYLWNVPLGQPLELVY